MERAKAAERRDLAFLKPVLERASQLEDLRDGFVRFRFADADDAAVRLSRGRAELIDEPDDLEAEPLLEIMGDRKRIQQILEGKKDARAQFLAGGLRIRGDLRYFGELAVELGILDEPL